MKFLSKYYDFRCPNLNIIISAVVKKTLKNKTVVDVIIINNAKNRSSSLHYIYIPGEEACTVWCYKRNGGSKSRGWTFPDGTTCQSHRSRYGKSMHCISGRCEVIYLDMIHLCQL